MENTKINEIALREDELYGIIENAYSKNMPHFVLDIWLTPFGYLDSNAAYFDEYFCSKEYVDFLINKLACNGLNITHYIFMDGRFITSVNCSESKIS